MAFNITMRILTSLRLTVKLQKKSNDILAAYELVSTVQLDLELLKANCEEEFHQWFSEIMALANELNISVSTPRITCRQVHRSNASADSPESYYRRNIMIPFLDHITSELEERFGPVHQTKVKLPYHLLLPLTPLPQLQKLVLYTVLTCHLHTCFQPSSVGGGHVHQHLWTKGQIRLKKPSYSVIETTTPTYLYRYRLYFTGNHMQWRDPTVNSSY